MTLIPPNLQTHDTPLLMPDCAKLAHCLPGHERDALLLVVLAQEGHGWELSKPSSRRVSLTWWSEFLPSRILLSARTSSTVGEFMSELTRRLRGQIGAKGEAGELHRQEYTRICAQGQQEQQAILDVLERQAAVLVTLTRANIDERKRFYRGQKEDDTTEQSAGLFSSGDQPAILVAESGDSAEA
jgi:hypothetical protein